MCLQSVFTYIWKGGGMKIILCSLSQASIDSEPYKKKTTLFLPIPYISVDHLGQQLDRNHWKVLEK